jgi:hypothetical protein
MNEEKPIYGEKPEYRSLSGTLLPAVAEGGAVGIAHAITTQTINALKKPKDEPKK